MLRFLLAAALLGVLHGVSLPAPRDCALRHKGVGLSAKYSENIAHAVHSMTVRGLQMYNIRVGPKNYVPTVNSNVSSPIKVVPHAPADPLPHDFTTAPMRMVDKILTHVGRADDGLGPNWSPLERVAHAFHMADLWERIRQEYDASVIYDPPTNDVCACLTDVNNNGVEAGVRWVAEHYKSGTPITLLGRPISKLTGSETWVLWKKRLLYYYTKPALHDSAMYLYCATKDL